MEQLKTNFPNLTAKTLERAERTQKEMHAYIDAVLKDKPHLSYQDAANTFLIFKIAEAEEGISAVVRTMD